MPITAAQLVAKVSVEGDAEAKAKLKGVSEEAQKTGEKAKEAGGGLSGMFKQALSFAAGQAIFAGIGMLKDQIASVFEVTMAHQDTMAQLNQVLRSTHDVSGMTAGALNDLADSFSKTTKFSADTVLGGENLLLTFTNIGQSVFPQATQAILDVSQAMHQDLKSSAIQVGKALADPLTGMTALQRIGVTFSASEKEQIKTMMAHNDIIGAQKVILKELSTEFGGSAQAAGKTFSGQLDILKNHFEDLKIKIGTAVMPILTNFLTFITGTVIPGLAHFGQMAGQFLAPLVPVFQSIASLAQGALKEAFGQIGGLFKNLFGSINPQQIIGFFKSIGDYARPILKQVGDIVGGQLKQDFQTFQGVVQNLASWWQSTMVPVIKQAMPGFLALGNVLFTQVVPALARLWAAGHQIVDALLPVFIKVFETLAPIIVRVGGFISGLLAQAIQYVLPYIMQATQEIVKFAKEIAERAMPWITKVGQLIGAVLGFVMDHWSQIWGVLGPIVKGVFEVIVGIIKVAWSIISGIFKVALDLLSGNWSGAWNDLKDMLGGVFDGIGSIIHGALGALGGMIGNVLGGIASQAFAWGGNIIKNLAGGIIGSIASAIGNAMSAVGSFISSHLPSSPAKRGPLRNLEFQGTQISEQIASGMKKNTPAISTALHMALSPIVSASLSPSAGLAGRQAGAPIIVQPPDIYLDGVRLSRGLMPYVSNAIRYGVGGFGQ